MIFLICRKGKVTCICAMVMRPWSELRPAILDTASFHLGPPRLTGCEGRAIVVDPDIYAVGDIRELLYLDMRGKAIMCQHK